MLNEINIVGHIVIKETQNSGWRGHHACGGGEDSSVHDVLCVGRGVIGPLLVGDHHPDHGGVPDAGERDVELAVAEAGLVEEHADAPQRLSLRLVDRHRVGDGVGELHPREPVSYTHLTLPTTRGV